MQPYGKNEKLFRIVVSTYGRKSTFAFTLSPQLLGGFCRQMTEKPRSGFYHGATVGENRKILRSSCFVAWKYTTAPTLNPLNCLANPHGKCNFLFSFQYTNYLILRGSILNYLVADDEINELCP